MANLQIFTFYRFVKIHNKYKIKKNLEINASISGKDEDLVQSLNYIKKI